MYFGVDYTWHDRKPLSLSLFTEDVTLVPFGSGKRGMQEFIMISSVAIICSRSVPIVFDASMKLTATRAVFCALSNRLWRCRVVCVRTVDCLGFDARLPCVLMGTHIVVLFVLPDPRSGAEGKSRQ